MTDLLKKQYLLDTSDYQQYKDLFFYSFDILDTEMKRTFLKREFKYSKVYGIKTDDQLQVSVTCIPFEVNFFDRRFLMSGIANVMSAPEYLPGNGVDTLINKALYDMYQNGTALSYLGPFSFDYYRRFGYEQVFENLQMTIPFNKLVRYKKPEDGYLKRYEYIEAQSIIGKLFAEKNNKGTIIRKSWWWKNLSLWHPDDLLAVYYNELSEVDGYLRYVFKEGNFVIRDMYYRTKDSFLGLMHFINKHRSIYENVIINSADINLRINKFVSDPTETKIEIKPSMMARIVDLKGFLNDYPIQLNDLETITLDIKDSLPWNNHIWQLTVKNGAIHLKESSKKADIVVSIQTLTKAMFGYQTLLDSYDIGDVQGDINKIRLLDKLFVKEKAKLKDDF
ncbi:GNAT family N-acetyltransferase [Companilactobacillus zhachilii]|uniref:GNAT family N-acetyltransferase n=1 Tax=Companilactobacillus zhachilii TaxID=2304606 RepID=UPI0040335ED3